MVEPDQTIPEIPDASIIKTLPGHIIYESSETAANAVFCDHRWILDEGTKTRCVLCDGMRELDKLELQIIEKAQAAGVVFLQWKERFAALERLTTVGKGRRRRKRKAGGARSKATGGVKTAVEVPEGFVPVKEAAAILGTDAKRLRKQIRSGVYEGLKIGGRVHVKITKDS